MRLKKAANEYKYHIAAGGGIGEFQGSKQTNNPEEAIKMWCEMQKTSPTDVSIIAKSTDSIELLNWARSNKETVRKILNSQDVYKADYIVDTSLDRARGVNESYDEYGGDQVYPFCAG